jgi:hypothetical protein
MSSLKQIEANRRNALKCTGPITSESKARSCRNAIRYRLTAEPVIGGLEDIGDYKAFEAAITADYDAETAVERELVLRLASVLWRYAGQPASRSRRKRRYRSCNEPNWRNLATGLHA